MDGPPLHLCRHEPVGGTKDLSCRAIGQSILLTHEQRDQPALECEVFKSGLRGKTLRDDAQRATVAEFDRQHRLSEAPARRRVEKAVLGSDYGASSYTTVSQAADLARRLELGPGVHLLDLGAGSGWPGLHLASVTGCRVVLADQPREGLRIAQRRAFKDELMDRCDVVQSSGELLPFRSEAFDAVTHTDVLC